MENRVYIIERERAKCQKVAEAFKELYDMESVVVLDEGGYGFVVLKYYSPASGFDYSETYTDSKRLFDELWQEWLETKLYLVGKGTPLLDKGYEGVFESLSEEEQAALIGQKSAFERKTGIYTEKIHFKENMGVI